MNCRFATIGARSTSFTRAHMRHGVTRLAPWNDMSVALHHCPGEGFGESQ